MVHFQRLIPRHQLPLQDPRTLDSSDKLRRLSVPRHAVTLKVLLHEGTFGRIYGGTFHDSNENKTVDAIIKTVSDEASKAQINTLLSEGTMMTGLSHNNILGILAVSHDCQLPPLLVYPYSPKGNLKRFLINCRLRGGEKYTLGTQDMVSMAIQVAVAGVYLHTQRLYHRDIAARNVVMDEHMHIKLADNALSRDIFPCDYHCLDDNENRPVKWMALESILEYEYSGASDVWSFGVFLWELVTLAQQPYVDIDPFELAGYLKEGYRLSQPMNCPDDLFGMMTCCWLSSPEERPTFIQLLACLQDFSTALNRFI
ncbi:hypothetical protein M8J76_010658 [Diaphorina citri]|nr:hypothetical protein M8J76_010658 [Diaphorina citri]